MLSKKIVFVLMAIICFGFVKSPTHDGKKYTVRWIICENSSLIVNGSTNLNRFSCAIHTYPRIDTIKIEQNLTSKKISLTGSMNIAIAGFDCKNGMMTKELRKTLKEDQFPHINIEFLSINQLPELNSKPVSLNGAVAIEIAGVKKRFEVNYTMSIDENKEITLLAIKEINFSDFKLVPPRKFGKLVQAKDQLSVALNLKMKAL